MFLTVNFDMKLIDTILGSILGIRLLSLNFYAPKNKLKN